MMNFFSRLIIVGMVLILVFTSLPSTGFASENEVTKVIEDNENERIAETTMDGVSTTATFDKELNVLTIEEEGKEPIVLSLGELSDQYLEEEALSTKSKVVSEGGLVPSKDNPEVSIYAATTKQNTFINYEYTITHSSPEKWQLRRPKGESLTNYYYKNVTRTSQNSKTLSYFRSQVESINSLEWRFIGSSLTATGLSWLSFILSVPTAGAGTLAAGLAALGAYGSALDAMVKIHGHVNKARAYYFSL